MASRIMEGYIYVSLRRKAYKTNERIIVGYDIRLLRFTKDFVFSLKGKGDSRKQQTRMKGRNLKVWEESICFAEIAKEC